MSGIIFSICSTLAISALPRRKNCGKVKADAEPGFASRCKLFNSAEFECINPSGDTQSIQSRFESYSRCRETCGWYQMQKRTTVRGDSLLQKQTRTWIFKKVRGDLPQKIQTSSTKTQSGRIITAYLVITSHIFRKSTRICDRNLVASQETKWKTSMWSLWCGECLCLSPWMPQFILEWITWRIYILPKISHNEQ